MLGDVKVSKKEDVKDEITIEGNDLNHVSLSCKDFTRIFFFFAVLLGISKKNVALAECFKIQ